jgi:hypothetical protein
MAIKKLVYEFDPVELLGVSLPEGRSKRREVLEELADYVRTEVLSYVGDGKSPVAGGQWKRSLSPEYKKVKEKISGSTFANLELYGDMLDALEARVTSKGTIQFGIWDATEAAKADGHNNFSGESELPAREFIPNEDKNQTFKKPIVDGMKAIAKEFFNGEDR